MIALAGACAGLPDAVRRHLVVCRDLDDLTEVVIRTINDVPRLNALQRQAFAAAAAAFDWDRSGRALIDALSALDDKERHAA